MSGTIKSREFSIAHAPKLIMFSDTHAAKPIMFSKVHPLRPIMFSVDNSALQTAGSPREVESSSNGKQNEHSHGSDAREQYECT
jgi:hypothetical protein